MDTEQPDTGKREELRRKAELRDRLIPRNDQVSLIDGFQIAGVMAEQLGVPRYKTPEGFARALRKLNLTAWEQEIIDFVKFIQSPDSTPTVKFYEVTSKQAIGELFKTRKEQRRKLDRQRKKAKKLVSLQTKSASKMMQNVPASKRKSSGKSGSATAKSGI